MPGQINLSSLPDEDDDWDDDDIDEETVVLADLITGPCRFFYEYDFGDSWRHEVVVASFAPVPLMLKFAVCIDGQRACPPEDCGGTPRYRDFLAALGDADDEEHAGYLAGSGGSFDPEAFDLFWVNAHLQGVR